MKLAVIGVGSIGQHHARIYADLPDVELVGICDSDSAVAARVANKQGTVAYTDHRRLLEETTPDAVSIAVPTALHEAVARDALDAGAHILVEKPIAATVEAGQRLIAYAAEKERQLMIGHIVRFNPALQLLKQKLDAGELGRIYQIICRRIGPFPARIRDVGVVVDLAPHDVDVMRFLTGLEPERVYAETERRIHTAHEDLLLGLLRFPNGIKGSLEINWLTPTKLREIVVLGEKGLYRVDDLTQDLYFYENAQASGLDWGALRNLRGVSEGQMIRFAVQRQEPLRAELAAFVQALRDGTPVPVSGADGLAALRIAQALVTSGQEHRVVAV